MVIPFFDDVVAPYLIEDGASLDLSDLTDLLAEAVVVRLEQKGFKPDEIAARINRDKSTVYEVLNRARSRREKNAISSSLESEESGDLWIRVHKYLGSVYPTPKSGPEIADAVGANEKKVLSLLSGLSKAGEVVKIGMKYSAKGNLETLRGPSAGRLFRALKTAQMAACNATAGDDATLFRFVDAKLDPEIAVEVVKAIGNDIRHRVIEGVTRSLEKDSRNDIVPTDLVGVVCLTKSQ